MAHTKSKRPNRKTRKTFTLSPESVRFLEMLCKNRHALSVSSVLDEILQSVRREQERATVASAVTDYYASLSREEVLEQTNWGEFGLREFQSESA